MAARMVMGKTEEGTGDRRLGRRKRRAGGGFGGGGVPWRLGAEQSAATGYGCCQRGGDGSHLRCRLCRLYRHAAGYSH